jgi:hypothetical protein
MIGPSTILTRLGSQDVSTRMLVDQQTTGDIIQAMLQKHEQCQGDYDKFSYLFDVGTVDQVCRYLFDFCKSNIAYVVEKTKAQYVSKPYTILKRGTGDCKTYALFCAGVLDSLKRKGKRLNWSFRFASYKIFKQEPYHVFVVVNDGSTGSGGAIYLDPVFDVYNYKKLPMWKKDYNGRNYSRPAKIAGMYADSKGCLNVLSDNDAALDAQIGPYIGDSTAQTGTTIIKVSAAAAAIPVVGWIAAAAGGIIGGALAIFGDPHQQSSDVLWLVQLYQEKVLGQTGITASNANDALTQQAQAWFSVVVGVPIGERQDYNILQSGDANHNINVADQLPTLTDQQRGQLYLNWKGAAVQGKVNLATATAAAHIAASKAMNPYLGPKAWAGLLAAPWTVQGQQAAAQSSGGSSLASLFSNKWLLLILIGLGAGMLLMPSHPIKHHRA